MGSNAKAAGEVLHVAIIGAGFAGLCMAIRLKRAGIDDFTIYEGAGDLGGTWRDNTYPGCACDIASHMYSYSFELNAEWPRVYSSWKDIQGYLQDCADKYDVRSHVRFDTRIAETRFDESTGLWSLVSESGETFRASVVAHGTGPLNKPSIPAIPGLEKFQGRTFHSSAWDHDFSLRGKTVAAIGTGASAIQYVPEIAPEVKRLHVFQRTPTWIVPRLDRAYTAIERWAFRRVPGWRRIYRNYLYWRNEFSGLAIIGYQPFNWLVERVARWHLRRQVRDEGLRKKLTPDYRLGCKRINLSDDYYPALQRDNVELVTEGIREITADGLIDTTGVERRVDAIIFGTGFITTEYVQPMKIYGCGGEELSARWQDGVETYLGITVAGYPNYFLLVGPNTGLGHNSVIFMIEAQVDYVMQAIGLLRSGVADAIDVRSDVQHAFNEKIQQALEKTSWASGCQSWYLTEDGKNYTIWPGFTLTYWWDTRRLRLGDHRLLDYPDRKKRQPRERIAA